MNLQAEPLIGQLKLLFLLPAHSQKVLVDEWQRVALKVDLLLDLVDSILDLIEIYRHAQESLLLQNIPGQASNYTCNLSKSCNFSLS